MDALFNNGMGIAALALCLVILVRDLLRNRKNRNPNSRLEARLVRIETVLHGVDGRGGMAQNIETVRERSDAFANKLMELEGKLVAIEKRLELLEGWRDDLARRV